MSQYGNYPITKEYKRQNRMNQLQQQVVQWAREKGLLTDVTPERIEKQSLKVLEEIGETAGAYLKGNREELIDGIGDIAVTIIILAEMKGHKPDFYYQADHFDGRTFNLLDVIEYFVEYQQYNENEDISKCASALNCFASTQGLKIEACLRSAYNVIAKRKGKMVGDTFIKEEV